MTNLNCCSCGILFGLPDDYYKNRVSDHKSFWCPNGHSQSFIGETEAEKYKRLYECEAAKSVDVRTRLEAASRAEQRAKNAVTKLKKRVAAGVCTCCNRTVSQLAAHMKTKHPEFLAINGITHQKQLPEKVQ